jgi:sugar O-acyltransferase (sialic acid O-acetyltransferase NeuD family)
VIYGAGGHGKVVAETLLAMGMPAEIFLDDDVAACARTVLGLPVLAAERWLEANLGSKVALGIGDNHGRARAADRLKHSGCRLFSAIHPSAVISKSAKLAEGVVILAGAVLNAECEIGEGAIINSGAIVEHDVRVGPYAHLSPNCATGGGVEIGAYSHIGLGASVLPRIKIGNHCTVGSGAVVVDDVCDGQVVYGIPAKVANRYAP